ncbi:4-hydroxyphenylacetate 3-hydroxylase C-terminal domain-containing protein [Paenibacillus rhizoplanae]
MVQNLSSSGLIMILSESDFDTSAGAYLNQYLKGTASEAWFRNALFRLAWELGAGAFGGDKSSLSGYFWQLPNSGLAHVQQL